MDFKEIQQWASKNWGFLLFVLIVLVFSFAQYNLVSDATPKEQKDTTVASSQTSLQNNDEEIKNAKKYSDTGESYYKKGQYDKAIEYYEKALVIRKKELGENHPDTATSYNNLGAAYHDKGQYDKAIEYLEKALAILTKFLPEDHPTVQIMRENIEIAKENKGQ
jgi:tetratricopeptide (TPR) repeat protein